MTAMASLQVINTERLMEFYGPHKTTALKLPRSENAP
jgi:hypothetical protein